MSKRINLFEQTKLFYEKVWDSSFDYKPQHISLYMFLLNQNNRSGWSEWFGIAFDTAMQGSCIGSKRTYYKCLSELQEQGLIKYKKGSNELRPAKVSVEVLKCTTDDTAVIPQPIPQDAPQGEPQGDTLVGREEDLKTLRPKDLRPKSVVKKFTPPTLQQVSDFISEKNYSVNAEKFFYNYESNGWMIGKAKMKNWKAALAKWNAGESKKESLDHLKGF